MRLYYMTTWETLEAFILPHNRLRVSTFDAVNDPFELLAIRQDNREERRKFEWLYKHWVRSLGFISFSDNWRSPLMWAHYAANHKGVCLGIEIPEDKVMKVSYEPTRLERELDMTNLETAVDPDVVRAITTTKFAEWAYEREWRMLIQLREPDPDTGLHYVEFSPDFELREILIGARCDIKPKIIREHVFGNTGEIHMVKVRAAFGEFKMVRQQNVQGLTVSPLHKVAMGWRNR